jgi:hypothetical protein
MKNITKIVLLALCLSTPLGPLSPLSDTFPIPTCYPNPCIPQNY